MGTVAAEGVAHRQIWRLRAAPVTQAWPEVLRCPPSQHLAELRLGLQTKAGVRVVATEEPRVGRGEGLVVCLLFDVLEGNRQLWTQGFVRRGHV